MITVAQVTPARFHHFDLARQLELRGLLKWLYTGYPKWKLLEHNEFEHLPTAKVKTFPYLQAPFMFYSTKLSMHWPLSRLRNSLGLSTLKAIDAFVATQPVDYSVLVAQSGCGRISGKRAKRFGANYICDRGSTHIRHQQEVVAGQFERFGEKYLPISSSLIDRELEEYESCDLITVPSSFAAETFRRQGVPPHKIRVIPYGVDLSRFTRVGHPEPDVFQVLFVGGISFRKGVPYLLDAFSKLKHPKKRLLLAGTLSHEMKGYLSRNSPDPQVSILGHVNQSDLPLLMATSTVLVLPSIEEGLALVQAQAMACGTPVIATRETGCEDLFTNRTHGIVVSSESSESISHAFEMFCDDPELRVRLGNAALARVREIGGWNEYGDRFSTVLTELSRGYS